MIPRLLLLLPLLLAACGDLPEPFIGNPGAAGRVLSQPPTPRLAVPPPTNALLPNEARQQYAGALAEGLQAHEVPAVVDQVRTNDWQLVATAELRGNMVLPKFSVLNPKSEDKGDVEGKPIPTQAWSQASAETLNAVASDAAPKISRLIESIQAAMLRADPNSLYNRVAKVQLMPVTGAPGDGNTSLTREMKGHLAALGPLVQDSPDGVDFIIHGTVKTTPLPGGQQRVAIDWTVTTPSGDLRGKISQGNDIPAGSLDHYWGDVAVVVANQGAGGINEVIARQSGREPGEPVHGQGQKPLVEGRKAGVEPVH